MQVEVCVQDHFSTTPQMVDASSSDSISEETWHHWFHKWLQTLHPHISEAIDYELSIRLTNDVEIQELNAQYRQQNQPTDVLAFAALEVDCPQPDELRLSQPLYLGDIVISVDTAGRQAQKQGHSLKIELAWLAAHGLLHLLGWDHPDDDRLMQMLNQQETLLESISLNIKPA